MISHHLRNVLARLHQVGGLLVDGLGDGVLVSESVRTLTVAIQAERYRKLANFGCPRLGC